MSSYSGNKPKRLPLSTTRITELAYPPFSLHFLRPSPYFLPCFELYVFPASVTSTGDWRRQHNDGEVIGKPQQKLFAKSNPPPKKIRWARHVARMGKRRGAYRVLFGILKERGHLEDTGVEWMIILKCSLTK